jgi:DNA-directed DNA polymerase III PolC
LLAATPSVADLARQAAADGLTHLALTDANALYGAVRFARACEDVGVQPVVGMSVTLAPPPDFPRADDLSPSLITLLAMDAAGYRSLSHLSSGLQGHPDREQRLRRGVTLDELAAHSQGVIAIFGGRRSWLERWLRLGDERRAGRRLARLAGIFDENSYLALEWHRPEDDALLDAMAAMGGRFGVPAVAVHPVYIMQPEHRPRLRLLAAIARNCRLEEVPARALPDEGDETVALHWLSPEALATRYARWPRALAESDAIAERCGPALPDGRPIWPALAPDYESGRAAKGEQEGVKAQEADSQSAGTPPPDALLERVAREGVIKRYGEDADAAIHQRLTKELAAIARHGYAPLFLVVADIVRYAREQRIPVSTRGSVANSLVAYAIEITTVDPIQHDLLFERFLNPARQDPPDIDLDFGSRRRDEVLAYVRRRYGEDRVALACTVNLMKPRSAVRETAKALGMASTAIARLSRLTPRSRHPGDRRKRKSLAEIAEGLPPDQQRALHLAAEIVGQPHHLSVHPGGTVITPGPLADYAPVQWSAKGLLILQYDHRDAERIGLTKIDLLGVRALSVLDAAARLVRKHYQPDFRLEDIPAGDALTGEMLSRGATVGVFQCESSGAQRTLRKLRARTVADLAIANALFKPGPATGGMAAAFVRRYRGDEPVRYLHPALEPILGHTKGVLIYQEQILRVATEIAGLSWEDANHLRRGMSKFKPGEMMALQQAFVAGCMRPRPAGPGFNQRQAEMLWEQVRAFAGYGFNQGHATAYADVSYRSAYIKAHWPAAYMAARLGERGGFHHPAIYMAEARRLGIPVRPPHINHSGRRFTLAFEEETPVLWMGLGAVRDLRESAIAAITAGRPFASLTSLLSQVQLQRRELTHLIQCGALDGLAADRNALLAQLPGAKQGALQLAFDFLTPDIEPETPAQRLAWERRILGLPMSAHPLSLVRETLPADIVSLSEVRRRRGQRLRTAGVRLPGWTGGEGYYFCDENDYVIAIPADEKAPPPPLWEPVIITGRWLEDDWGRAWLEVERWQGIKD